MKTIKELETVQEFSVALADNWIKNYTQSGVIAFRRNQKELDEIADRAKGLGIWKDVYALANKMMKGEL